MAMYMNCFTDSWLLKGAVLLSSNLKGAYSIGGRCVLRSFYAFSSRIMQVLCSNVISASVAPLSWSLPLLYLHECTAIKMSPCAIRSCS
uniref:Uncharacterized protein n=1 Tax=Setaria italica TaxID=4555 RepID=K3Y3U2_SETIT